MDVSKLRLPIALVVAIIMQSSAAIWFFAQQSQTVSTIERDVAALTERVSVERLVNDERDIRDNQSAITDVVDTVDEVQSNQILLQNRVSQVERQVQGVEIQLRYIVAPLRQDLSGSADPHSYNSKDGM